MEKDKIYDELAKVNVEVNKLSDECRAKPDLSDGLRRAHVDQQAKIHQAKLEIEKLAQELNAKAEEIRAIRQTCEELQSSLRRKEIFIQQTSFSNEKLQAEHRVKIATLKRILSGRAGKDIEMRRNESKGLKDTEEHVLRLEEETCIVKDQLKWKREQFSHLEEAHDKLRTLRWNGRRRNLHLLKSFLSCKLV